MIYYPSIHPAIKGSACGPMKYINKRRRREEEMQVEVGSTDVRQLNRNHLPYAIAALLGLVLLLVANTAGAG